MTASPVRAYVWVSSAVAMAPLLAQRTGLLLDSTSAMSW